jgi:quercetin dioxygenase-like cupin family protein
MTPVEFEATVLAEGYSAVVHIDRAADYRLGDHQHSFDACALITAGEFVIAVDGVSRSYKAGEIFRLPAGTVHQENAGLQGVSYIAGRRERGAA